MDEYPDEPAEEREADATHSASKTPGPAGAGRCAACLWAVRRRPWPALPSGAVWSEYYAALRGVDPLAPVLVGGGVGLAVGAFLWAFFPYKGRPQRRPHPPERDRS